jgi:hypothetical protein
VACSSNSVSSSLVSTGSSLYISRSHAANSIESIVTSRLLHWRRIWAVREHRLAYISHMYIM